MRENFSISFEEFGPEIDWRESKGGNENIENSRKTGDRSREFNYTVRQKEKQVTVDKLVDEICIIYESRG